MKTMKNLKQSNNSWQKKPGLILNCCKAANVVWLSPIFDSYLLTINFSRFVLLILSLMFVQSAYSQSKEGNNWYFGNAAGMTWNTTQIKVSAPVVGSGGYTKTLTGLPTPLTGSVINQNEGVFGMSDKDGQLLFYSDGMTVYNKSHQVMQNGSELKGHISSTQSGIIIIHPGGGNRYIAFTIGAYEQSASSHLNYSIIDMTSGLGAVTTKNVELTTAPFHTGLLSEQLTAVKHSNGTDYWVISISKGPGAASALNVWRVDASGVHTECYKSYQLPINVSGEILGYLRFSADGTRFAWDIYGQNNILFGTFDPATGDFPILKHLTNGYLRGYHAEFSPSGEILYVGEYRNSIHAMRFVDLLTATSYNSIPKRIIEPPSFDLGALQLGPDGRIYGTKLLTSNMYVIDNVENYNNFTVHEISGLMAGVGRLGLPNFLPHIFAPTPVGGTIGENQLIYRDSIPKPFTSTEEATCKDAEGISEAITYLWEHSADSLSWTPAPLPNNQSTYQSPALTATTYYRRAATSNTCGTVHSNVLKITVAPALNAGTIGDDQQILLNGTPTPLTSVTSAIGGIGTITNQWQSSTDGITWTNIPGATGPDYAPGALTTTTHYRRVASDDNISAESNVVTITVSGSADMITITVSDTNLCSGDPVTLSASAPLVTNPQFKWYDAPTGGTLLETAPTFTPSPNLTTTTTFYVSVSGNGLAESTRRVVTVTVRPRSLPSMIKVEKQ